MISAAGVGPGSGRPEPVNREIARTLSMAVRTVEGHLSHVYAKLEIRSRTELAAFDLDV